jgi:pimeloyl-ACP methyl ester carboxylesterase
MYVDVDGARLFFDVDGPGVVVEGGAVRDRPTLVLLHGGPGFDHHSLKPAFRPLADTAQLVWLDHRGQGRSRGGAADDPAGWTLARWADDVRGLCDALGINRPVVLGQSFGGYVAQAYLVRHPGHAAGVVLSSTAARFTIDMMLTGAERRGGGAARARAGRLLSGVVCVDVDEAADHAIPAGGADGGPPRRDVLAHFAGEGREMWRMDFREALRGVRTPVLLLAGDRDPVLPWEATAEIADHLPAATVEFRRFPHAGHGVFRDDPDGALALVRSFVARVGGAAAPSLQPGAAHPGAAANMTTVSP